MCQTISPAQYRTPALYDPHYIGPPTVNKYKLDKEWRSCDTAVINPTHAEKSEDWNTHWLTRGCPCIIPLPKISGASPIFSSTIHTEFYACCRNGVPSSRVCSLFRIFGLQKISRLEKSLRILKFQVVAPQNGFVTRTFLGSGRARVTRPDPRNLKPPDSTRSVPRYFKHLLTLPHSAREIFGNLTRPAGRILTRENPSKPVFG